MPWLAPSPLPFCRISTCVKYCEHDYHVTLDGKVYGVGETPEQRAADTGAEILIPERAMDNPLVGGSELFSSLDDMVRPPQH
jgi:hypothetical protein